MNLNLSGQNALIVGGATGIGQAIAEGFAAEGAHVAIADINPAAAQVAERISQQFGVKACSHRADVTDLAAMRKAAQTIENELGPVEHLVYTVGIGSGKVGMPFWNIEPHHWQKVIDVCLIGAVNTLHAVSPPMRQRRSGTICMIASVAGQFGAQTDPPYSAAKAGLINFMQVAAKDMAPYMIRVNAINPGLIDTPLQQRIHAGVNLARANRTDGENEQPSFGEWFEAKIKQVIPLQRQQTPEDIAKMTIFLASDSCSNVTGQAVNVDGGFVMHS